MVCVTTGSLRAARVKTGDLSYFCLTAPVKKKMTDLQTLLKARANLSYRCTGKFSQLSVYQLVIDILYS